MKNRCSEECTPAFGGILFDEYKEKRYASPPLLKRMVSLGYFGPRSGKGFYDYSGEKPVPMPLV